ncbi:hypothetical protein [Desulfobacter vibrioformis]|uniref:hypothetical protein n=1 Tax=Desulfobacter vibrioformis TaxID=34031 RepID=UPI0005558871|nr:hypothetical protein [Desulfobacter vibrioformis]
MSMTDKYDFETYAYSVTDKSGIATANIEKLDSYINSRMLGTYGETIDRYEALYLKSDGKYWLAQQGTTGACIGLAVDDGVADDSARVQRVGSITNTGWAWTGDPGDPVYVDPSTPGAITETQPSGAEPIGFLLSATSIFLCVGAIPGGGPKPYDIGGTYNGTPTTSMVLLRYPMPRAVTFPVSLADSKMIAGTAATAETVFSLQKDTGAGGVEFGTATFAASGTSATFAAAYETSFVAGDILTLVAPVSADATLADLGWAIVGTK